MYSRLIVFSFVALCAACNQSSSEQRTATEDTAQAGPAAVNNPVTDSPQVAAPVIDSTAIKAWRELLAKAESPYVKITSSTVLEVLQFSKAIDSNANFLPNYAQACDKWTLTAQKIEQILRTSKEIAGSEWHYLYSDLPCSYTGTVNINGKLAAFSINAGAVTTLAFKDTSVWLGYAKPDFKKYFLEGQDIP